MRLIRILSDWKLYLLLPITLAALLGSCGGPSASSAGEDAVPADVLQSLEGNYSMKVTDPSGTHYSTAVVKELASGQFQVARITVYGPVYYSFSLEDGAVVNSSDLGVGAITYKPAIKKTTISFKKQEFSCELSK